MGKNRRIGHLLNAWTIPDTVPNTFHYTFLVDLNNNSLVIDLLSHYVIGAQRS